jgi:hypothetical protein
LGLEGLEQGEEYHSDDLIEYLSPVQYLIQIRLGMDDKAEIEHGDRNEYSLKLHF